MDLERERVELDQAAVDVQDDGLGELIVRQGRIERRRILVQPEAEDLLLLFRGGARGR